MIPHVIAAAVVVVVLLAVATVALWRQRTAHWTVPLEIVVVVMAPPQQYGLGRVPMVCEWHGLPNSY